MLYLAFWERVDWVLERAAIQVSVSYLCSLALALALPQFWRILVWMLLGEMFRVRYLVLSGLRGREVEKDCCKRAASLSPD